MAKSDFKKNPTKIWFERSHQGFQKKCRSAGKLPTIITISNEYTWLGDDLTVKIRNNASKQGQTSNINYMETLKDRGFLDFLQISWIHCQNPANTYCKEDQHFCDPSEMAGKKYKIYKKPFQKKMISSQGK